jgi:hypothetical protein
MISRESINESNYEFFKKSFNSSSALQFGVGENAPFSWIVSYKKLLHNQVTSKLTFLNLRFY